jgi:hypothetical protein
MSYLQIGAAVLRTDFHDRVRGAVIDLSAAILGAATASGSIQDDASNDLTTTACKNWCINFLKGTTAATERSVAGLLLLNSNVAAGPFTCADADLNWQLKHVFLTIVSMG